MRAITTLGKVVIQVGTRDARSKNGQFTKRLAVPNRLLPFSLHGKDRQAGRRGRQEDSEANSNRTSPGLTHLYSDGVLKLSAS